MKCIFLLFLPLAKWSIEDLELPQAILSITKKLKIKITNLQFSLELYTKVEEKKNSFHLKIYISSYTFY